MDQKDFLSVENMVNMAMGLSMASFYANVMNRTNENMLRSMDLGASVPQRYVYAMIGGRQQGPFSLGELAEHIRSGAVTPDTYIWKVGMQAWKPAREVEDLRPALGALPPQTPDL